jgi:hypothetical protein
MTAVNKWVDLLDDRERNRQHQIKDAGRVLPTYSTAGHKPSASPYPRWHASLAVER